MSDCVHDGLGGDDCSGVLDRGGGEKPKFTPGADPRERAKRPDSPTETIDSRYSIGAATYIAQKWAWPHVQHGHVGRGFKTDLGSGDKASIRMGHTTLWLRPTHSSSHCKHRTS